MAGPNDDIDRPLARLLQEQARRSGGHETITLPDATLSLSDLLDRSDRFAGGLLSRGFGEGTMVAAHCGNSIALLIAWFGTGILGGVFLPVNQLVTGPALAAMLATARAEVIVCGAENLSTVRALQRHIPSLRLILVHGDADPENLDDFITSSHASGSHRPSNDPSRTAKLMFTSGSTGTPKGVRWSRRCESVWARAYAAELVTLAQGETAYSCLPLAHVTCQGTVVGALLNGGSVTVDVGFDPFRFWHRVRAADARIFTYVGTLLTALARRPRAPGEEVNPVRRVVGAAAPARAWREIEERFGLDIVETWGQTETASCWFAPPRTPMRPGTIGVPSARCEARIVAADGAPVAAGEPGELWLRPRIAHTMFDGYLDDSEPAPWNGDGWYRSGDLIMRDREGEYRFVSRIRDAIRRHGETIPPSLIEDAALEHGDVLEAVAVGVADPRSDGEQVIKLCVVPRAAADFDERALARHLRERLPRLLQPSRIAVYAEFPKTGTTRVQRWRLSEE